MDALHLFVTKFVKDPLFQSRISPITGNSHQVPAKMTNLPDLFSTIRGNNPPGLGHWDAERFCISREVFSM